MKVPNPLIQIAADVKDGRVRRCKVRTLMGWYGLKRRRDTGIAVIRAHCDELGIETVPVFDTVDFDSQVRFVVAGQAADDGGPLDEAPAGYSGFSIQEEIQPGKPGRVRIALRTYDAFDRLRETLIAGRRAEIHMSGQNARREDRDQFPFVLVIALPPGAGIDDVRRWADEACNLDPELEDRSPKEGQADTPAAPTQLDIHEQLASLAASLRASFVAETERVRVAMEAKVEEIRFDAITQLAKQLNDKEALRVIAEFEEEFKEKNRALETHIRELNVELQLAYERLADAETEEQEPAADDAYPTMAATVRLFENLCTGADIVVHDNAIKSAGRSGCTRRREVLLFLITLAELSNEIYSRGGLHQPIKDWFSRRGYDYAPADAQITAEKYGTERTIQLPDGKVQMQEHVTLFPNTDQCVTIYWYRDEPNRQLIVGYVGRHLRTISR